MIWNQFYNIRSYARTSLWIIPFIAIPFELVAVRILHRLDDWLGWSFLDLGIIGAQATLQAIVTATLSFIVFTFGSLLVAIQVASAQLTPRIIATTLLRDDVVKYTVGLFIFTLLFALSAQNRIDKDVHQLVLFVAALLGILCFAAFFFLIDYASKLLRPISILRIVGNNGLAVIASVYPVASRATDREARRLRELGAPDRVVLHQGAAGIVLAVNIDQVVAQAGVSMGVVEVAPQVGDFVAIQEPLFNLYGDARSIEDSALRDAIAFGSERTIEQDPTFAFRIVIDIALRALSAAINDPTTAVLAIDQLHRMLRSVGNRHLRTEEICDASGRPCVILRTPNWEDFVSLTFSEIRQCGAGNLQIARRLRAMIENLMQTLPVHRHEALREQLTLLEREIQQRFKYPEELVLARVPDSQGLGGRAAR